ncbi:AaceriAER192Wp [[Ashbya] aceris (nom. inval.)]|nr:AaceriAER192Wp [[Ashbya] aceris (nom. inval.)]
MPSDRMEEYDIDKRHAKTTAPPGTPDSESSGERVERIRTAGEHNEYIYIGRQKFLKSDLYEAFGGTLNPGLAPAPAHKFANPAPLGLSAFALTTFVLSMYNCGARGIAVPNVAVAVAMFYGGLVQLAAGMWEMAMENTFGATALSSYGGFWLSYGAINIPWFGVKDAYKAAEDELVDAVGIYLLAWSIFTYMLTMLTLKSTLAFFSLFFLLGTTFLLLAIAEFTRSDDVKHAAGVVGVIVAFIAWYNAYAGIASRENAYIMARPIPLPRSQKWW